MRSIWDWVSRGWVVFRESFLTFIGWSVALGLVVLAVRAMAEQLFGWKPGEVVWPALIIVASIAISAPMFGRALGGALKAKGDARSLCIARFVVVALAVFCVLALVLPVPNWLVRQVDFRLDMPMWVMDSLYLLTAVVALLLVALLLPIGILTSIASLGARQSSPLLYPRLAYDAVRGARVKLGALALATVALVSLGVVTYLGFLIAYPLMICVWCVVCVDLVESNGREGREA